MVAITEHLRVYIDGRFAGDLVQNGQGRVSFTYDDAYEASGDPTPLSFVIGLNAEHKASHVRNWFDGLLPDNGNVRDEWAVRYRVSARNPLALLRHVGRDAAGAIQVVPAGESADDEVARTGDVQWLSDADLEELLDGLRNQRGDWGREFRAGRWSLAGAQNKVALHQGAGQRKGHGFGIPLDSTPTTHILKASIGGYRLHDINEYACQRAARLLNIPAATTTLLAVGDQRALVSTRYDRLATSDGVLRRIHQEDLCQALGVAPTLKYQSEGGPGLAGIKRVLDRIGTVRGRQLACITFFDYLCFNVIIGATDNHAKNFSILHAGDQSRLAPAYDLASGLPYLTEPIESSGLRTEPPRSALKIGTTYDLSAIGESDLARCARTLGLNPHEGVERYRDLAARAPGAFEDIAATFDGVEHATFVRDLAGQVSAHVNGRWRNGALIPP